MLARDDHTGNVRSLLRLRSSAMSPRGATMGRSSMRWASSPSVNPRFGFRKLFVLLRRAGHPWDHKRVQAGLADVLRDEA